ncbi:MAG: peptidase S16 [Alphaproteobacteria bacterium]|nr:peptidase S16 [Alphaproteobacteria bacterium]
MTETRILPIEIPLFPLGGVILLPGESLPLNVFEPRYLNMVDDVRRQYDHIGIIQTVDGSSVGSQPTLAKIGCAGRLEHFEETDDGRYLISLRGVSRFELEEELDARVPYRLAKVSYRNFRQDLEPPTDPEADRERFIRLLQAWFAQEGMGLNWDEIGNVPLYAIIDQLAMNAPFSAEEKARLLVSRDSSARLLDMEEILAARLAGAADGPLN